MTLQFSPRQRRMAAGVVIAALLMVLALRWGVTRWQDMTQWQALAQAAAGLYKGPVPKLEDVRQSAQARGIALADIEPMADGWHLRGQVASAALLQAWLQGLQAEGLRPVQWGLEQGTDGLRFDVKVGQ